MDINLANLTATSATVRVVMSDDPTVRWVLDSSPFISVWTLIPNYIEFEIPVTISYDLPGE